MTTHTLSTVDREFFSLVARVAFANPFGEERHRADLAIGESPSDLGRQPATERAVARVKERLNALPSTNLADYGADDGRTLEAAILFDVFHDFGPDMDALVGEQLARGDEPVDVAFAEDMLARLVGHGMTYETAQRRLCILYQMRRAYYFIHTRLVGEAASIRRLRQRLWANLFTDDLRLYDDLLWDRMEDFSTFLVGETGTGKGTAAAALGYSGWLSFDAKMGRFQRSFTQSFLPINLSQYPAPLIESELFGHKRGAFTGAVDDHAGVFARCHRHGAIFLDEIGEVDKTVQVKLLRVLQERVFAPVGGHQTHRFEGRVIAATNQPVGRLREEGQFRNDFYYRLCSDIIEVPPLRTRIREAPGELELLLTHIAQRIVGSADAIVDKVLAVIDEQLPADYEWPGNVRELEQCVRRVIIAGEYGGDLAATSSGGDAMHTLYRKMDAEELEVRELTAAYCQILYERHGNYNEVGRRIDLDWRTVKRYVEESE